MSDRTRPAGISALVLLCGCGGGGNGADGVIGGVPPPPPGGGGDAPPGTTYSLVHAFMGGAEGARPYDGVIGDVAGNLYGTTWAGGDLACDPPNGCGTVFMIDASGNLTTLHAFAGSPTDGALPSGPLTRDIAGNLYGTTSSGGIDLADCGTIFKLDAAGNETVLHQFTCGEGGFEPAGGVLMDSHGNLYGVTRYGGHDDRGTVFKFESDGTFTILHRFAADGTEGAQPESALVADAAGNLYGVTSSGGAGSSGGENDYGTVFRIDSAGVFTTLHDFSVSNVAWDPRGSLMLDDAGNLYGATELGGDEIGGTIFRLDPEGEISILHEFRWDWATSDGFAIISGDPGGAKPSAGLAGDPAGIVYGTTWTGGSPRRGIVYRFDLQSNAFDVLHTFTDAQGGFVEASFWRDSAGVMYGTTPGGGDLTCNQDAVGCGTVFRLDPAQLQ